MQIRQQLLAATFASLAVAAAPTADAAVTGSTRFIPTMLVYYGGGPGLTSADVPKLAKYELIDIDRFRYDQINGNTWAAIKGANPKAEIYLYEMGPESQNYMDSTAQVYLNGMGRYNVSRGHPMGTLNGNHPELYLLDSGGNRVYSRYFSNTGANQYWHLMDFGSSAYQSYWMSAVKADIIDQPWKADGIFTDNCVTFASAAGYNTTAAKYASDTAWSNAMNAFSSAIAGGVHAYGQKLWCNKGSTWSSAAVAAWKALDSSANHPDVLLEEGAFAVEWGADVQFYPEDQWKNQVDNLGQITNSKIGLMSHTQLSPGGSGTDNWGKPVTFWQTLYYAIGSMLIGKNATLNNAYLYFSSGTGYNYMPWYDEYDRIDLGQPVASYVVTNVGGVNVYWREFQNGYVAVNPTANNVATFTPPQPVRQVTHSNILSTVSTLPIVNSVAVPGHSAVILYKTTTGGGGTSDTTPPSVPAGLTGTAPSPAQVNLTWNASTDNVGVTGYIVYLNDAQLATVTTTSYQHTGLTAGTTYNYRVSAFDAVPNHSAWTATPVSVTTPTSTPPADTTPPSTPTGVGATGVSTSQVAVSWAPSTDNVGVTGYRVYRNGTMFAVLGAVTSVFDSGLPAGTSYLYTVAAVDAAGNLSAQSTAVRGATLPGPDTTAPSVPAGLVAAAVSPTQVSLTWSPSTDNIAVTGYYVYVNDVPLTTTTTTSFSHTGLTPGVTYNYRVSAYDAVPNHSAWTAAVSATTPVSTPVDTTAPSVPTNLRASNIKPNQITLTWNPSKDNAGVAGYYVYLNDVPLATTVGTTFTHTGLNPNTTYKYRVSAYDAVPNHSAWTGALSVKTKH